MHSTIPGAFGLPRPEAQLWLDPRQINVLRLLGRLEMMSSSQIYTMEYDGSLTRRTMQRQLEQLHVESKIWQSTVRYSALPGHGGKSGPPRKFPYIYGLTPEGKALLEGLGVEHDQRSLDGLRCREPRGRRISAPTIAHDMVVSWWCSSVLMAAKASRLCTEVFVQSEFTVHEKQRFDALVVLRLNPERPRAEAGTIPWFEGRPCPPEAIELRLGLEVDMATEALSVLAGKAAVTRDLHAAGLYHELFGGPVRTVFLVPTRRRAAQIAAEWRSAWPETWGVIATTSSSEHAEHGTLWGDYRALADGTQSVSLLDELVEGADRRVRRRRTVTLADWVAALGDASGVQ
ncbi:MAG: hypothetical protein HGA45_39145 [Chloroflexales bacterium]|nr:hypothetical protein [Chloroflexales bacterium]